LGVNDGLPIYLVSGEILVPDYRNLWANRDGELVSPTFDTTELGTKFPPVNGEVLVYTGTRSNGVAFANFEMGSGRSSSVGAANYEHVDWMINPAISLSDGLLPMYAISEVLTAVPEPTVRAHIAVTLLSGFVFLRHRDRTRTNRS